MEPGEYDALVQKASSGSYGAATELLLFMRTHKIHQPELVLLHGGRLLKTSRRKLGDEQWTVMEQVFIAAVEAGMVDWRDYCIKQLSTRFPSSTRVERLKGLQKESQEQWAEAKTIYKEILKERPEDSMAHKRLIAISKQQGRITEAIESMVAYLDTFCTDTEVWHELAELYIESGSLPRAVYCYEELIMHNPRSMYHILSYAELLYSTGDFETSRKYFSLACYIDGTSLRALWGLVLVNGAMADKDKGDEKMAQLQTFTLDKLKAVYKGAGAHGKLALTLIGSGLTA